jgi:methyl-accepting chemotaxis protein
MPQWKLQAGRSATAAKEIKSLVQDSVIKVGEGSNLVNQSGTQLDEIVLSVKKVADIIAEISAASQEQATGIEQVNKAIMQMDQITQQNAALVEEAAAASQSMTSQAITHSWRPRAKILPQKQRLWLRRRGAQHLRCDLLGRHLTSRQRRLEDQPFGRETKTGLTSSRNVLY